MRWTMGTMPRKGVATMLFRGIARSWLNDRSEGTRRRLGIHQGCDDSPGTNAMASRSEVGAYRM